MTAAGPCLDCDFIGGHCCAAAFWRCQGARLKAWAAGLVSGVALVVLAWLLGDLQ